MIPAPKPDCPSCGQNNHSYKVSLLFIAASARLNHHEEKDRAELDNTLSDLLSQDSSEGREHLLRFFVESFSPPRTSRQSSRSIHPDWMVFFGCAIGLFFAYQMALQNSGSLPIMISLVAIGLLLYLLSRRPVLKRYQYRLQNEKGEAHRVDQAMARWMQLYFCTTDQCVYDPEQGLSVSIEQIGDLLYGRTNNNPTFSSPGG